MGKSNLPQILSFQITRNYRHTVDDLSAVFPWFCAWCSQKCSQCAKNSPFTLVEQSPANESGTIACLVPMAEERQENPPDAHQKPLHTGMFGRFSPKRTPGPG